MKTSKPAIKSFGVWGSLGSFMGILGVITQLRELIAASPELIDETRLALLAIFTAVSSLVALVGRWKAMLPIRGLFKDKG